MAGATYDEYFTPNATILICNSKAPSHEKSEHASLWAIPVVDADWLWECIRKGQCLSLDKYKSQGSISHVIPPKTTDLLPACGQKMDERDKLLFRDGIEIAKKHAKKRLFGRDPGRTSEQEVPAPGEVTGNELHTEDGFLAQIDIRQAGNHHGVRQNTSNDCNFQEEWHREEDQPRPNKLTIQDSFTQSGNTAIQEHLPQNPPDTFNPPPIPLKEISHNSTPRPSPSPPKSAPTVPLPLRKPSDQESLGTTIHSLLTHHQQRTASTTITPASFESHRPGRRKRHLLGRAPSNLSNRSISLSCASSIDTLNTDGLGTPLEPCISNPPPATNNDSNPPPSTTNYDHLLQIYDSDDEARREINKPPMTQLGYEDPEVAAWRERVVMKMGGKEKLREEEGAGRRVRVTGTVKDEGVGGRRTRRGGR